MNHTTMQANVSALYDGELSAQERRVVLTHLKTCAACRQLHHASARLTATLFWRAEAPPSDALVQRVMDRIAEVPAMRRSWWPVIDVGWLVPALGLAVSLLVLVGPIQQAVSVEALLLADGRESLATPGISSVDVAAADDVFGVVMEER